MKELTVRLAADRDLETIVKLYSSCIGIDGCVWNECYPTGDDARRDHENKCLFGAFSGGELVGCASIVSINELSELGFWHGKNERAAEIARVAVAREYRKKGYAQQMVAKVVIELEARGYESVRLLAAKCNPAALRLYEKLGFVRAGECQMYGNDYFAYEKIL